MLRKRRNKAGIEAESKEASSSSRIWIIKTKKISTIKQDITIVFTFFPMSLNWRRKTSNPEIKKKTSRNPIPYLVRELPETRT